VVEETSRAGIDTAGRFVRLKGLTAISRGAKRLKAQDLLITELDQPRQKVLARVACGRHAYAPALRTMDEFVKALHGRIQSRWLPLTRF